MIRALIITSLLAIFLATPIFAQSDSSTPPPSSNQSPAPPADAAAATKAPPPKKVWTNDDMKHSGEVSVVGDKRNQNYKMTPQKPADAATISHIKQNLEKLQAQLEDVTKKLNAFQQFQEGVTVSTSGSDIKQGYTRVPVGQQIPVLQEKKKQLEAQISDLYDEARKKGIEPGQLR